MSTVFQSTLLLYLFPAAVFDRREREIPLLLPAACFLTGILLRLLSGGNLLASLGGCIPGALLLLMGFVSKQAIGYGDGAMLLSAGIYLHFTDSLCLLLYASLLSATASGILLAAKKIHRKETLAFLPFLLAGYVALLALS